MTSSTAAPQAPTPKTKPASTEALASRMAASLDAAAVEPASKASVVPAPAVKDASSSPAASFPTPDLDGMYRLVKDGISRVSKTVESVQETARDTTKLMIGSRSLVTERTIGIQRTLLEMMELNFTTGLRAMQAIARAGNVGEAFKIQASYCRDAVKTLQSQGETLRTLSTDLAKDVREPFQAQVQTSVERMKSALRPH